MSFAGCSMRADKEQAPQPSAAAKDQSVAAQG
jgi:hypothetical protein